MLNLFGIGRNTRYPNALRIFLVPAFNVFTYSGILKSSDSKSPSSSGINFLSVECPTIL